MPKDGAFSSTAMKGSLGSAKEFGSNSLLVKDSLTTWVPLHAVDIDATDPKKDPSPTRTSEAALAYASTRNVLLYIGDKKGGYISKMKPDGKFEYFAGKTPPTGVTAKIISRGAGIPTSSSVKLANQDLYIDTFRSIMYKHNAGNTGWTPVLLDKSKLVHISSLTAPPISSKILGYTSSGLYYAHQSATGLVWVPVSHIDGVKTSSSLPGPAVSPGTSNLVISATIDKMLSRNKQKKKKHQYTYIYLYR